MHVERFVITTSVDGKAYRKIWKAKTPITLGFPFNLRISRLSNGIEVETIPSRRELEQGIENVRRSFEFGHEVAIKGFDLKLRRSALGGADSGLLVNIHPAGAFIPVYESGRSKIDPRLWGKVAVMNQNATSNADETLFIFDCVGKVVQTFGRLGSGFTGYSNGKAIFRMKRERGGIYRLRSLVDGLELKTPQRAFHLRKREESSPLAEMELAQSVISLDPCDWYFASCPIPKAEKAKPEQEDAETEWFKKAIQSAAVGFFTLAMVVATLPQTPNKVIERVVDTTVDSERPREIVVLPEEVIPPEVPKPVVKPLPKRVPPPPLKELKKPEPKKLIEPPRPKFHKLSPPKPAPLPKHELHKPRVLPKPKPAPDLKAREEAAKRAEATRRAEAERAAEAAKHAEAARAAEAAKRAEAERVAEAAKQAELERQAEARRAETERVAAIAAKQAEAERVAEAAKQAEIERAAEAARQAEATRQAEAARQAEIARQAEAARVAEVARQAEAARAAEAAAAARRVKARALAQADGSGSGAGQVKKPRITGRAEVGWTPGHKSYGFTQANRFDGLGNLDDSDLEGAMNQHHRRFQSCYENSLHSGAHLSGNATFSWKIDINGHPSEVNIINTAGGSAALTGCLSKEIRRIAFPEPDGGPVFVSYSFHFSQ